MIDLRKLRHFVALIDLGSFSRAAESLGLSQPALSRSIQALEQELGLTLVDRGRDALKASVAGAQLLEEGRGLLRHAEHLDDNIAAWASGSGGRLKVAMGSLVAALLGPFLMDGMKRLRPNAGVFLDIAASDELQRRVRSLEVELVVASRMVLGPAEALEIESIAHVPLGLLVADGHPLTGRDRLKMADIAPFPLACGPQRRNRAHYLFAEADLLCDNYGVLCDVVRRTQTVCLGSSLMAGNGMVTLPLPVDIGFPGETEFVIARLADRPLSPLAAVAWDMLREWRPAR